MSATQTVSPVTAQSVPAGAGSLSNAGASGQLAGSAFEQALFQFLQFSTVEHAGLTQPLEGVELPSGGDELPPLEAILQQLSEALNPEQMEKVRGLLNGEAVNEDGLPEGLLSSINGLLKGVESGEISQNDVQQLKNWLADLKQTPSNLDEQSDLSIKDNKLADAERRADIVNPEYGVRGAALKEQTFQSPQTGLKPAEDGVDSDEVAKQAVIAESSISEKAVEATHQTSSSQVQASQEIASSKNVTVDARAEAKPAIAASSQPQPAVVATSNQQNSGDNGAANQQQSGSQQFRDALIAQRTDANARDSADTSRAVLGNSFVLSGQSAPEPAARLNASLSGFQQLQQMYAGDNSSQVALGAGARFGTAAWTPSMSQRIAWMANQQVSHAEIRLDPPDLGTLNIRLTVQNDQASVSFVSPSPQVRDALEQQMPRLREMLEEQGIQLENGDVSAETGSREREANERNPGNGGLGEEDNAEAVPSVMASVNGNLTLVDYYA